MPNRRDLNDIANYLVPNPGDKAWVVDPDLPEHMHHGQTSGEPHSDGYYMYNRYHRSAAEVLGEPHSDGYYMYNDGTPSWLKYHSDDKEDEE